MRNKALIFFYFVYWHDRRFKNCIGGPIKVYELATNLSKLGHRVFLFIPKVGYPEKQTSSHVVAVPFIDLPILRFISFQVIALLLACYLVVKIGRPNIFYVRIMWCFMPMLFAKMINIPAILEINDSPHRAYANIKNMCKRRLVHLIDKITYHLSSHLLPVTKRIAENLHQIDGVSWKKMTVMPSGANTDLFRPIDKSLCCERLKFDPSYLYVGFIGTFFPYQGLDILIESAPSIIREFPKLFFLLVGDGQTRTTCTSKVAEKNLNAHFIFTGQVPYQDVPFYCGVMDVCVAPFMKTAGESSPVKVFDYLACGKPVVMSDVGETGKIFEHSGVIHLVPPETPSYLSQSILRLMKNHGLRSALGKKGRAFILSRYSRKHISKTVESLAFHLCYGNQFNKAYYL